MTSIDQTSISIRDRRDEDLATIVDLALESMIWHADTFTDIRAAPDREALTRAYAQPDPAWPYFRVAELEGSVVAFLSASINPPRDGGIEALNGPSIYIADIVVTKSARRHGVAAALLGDLDHWATTHDCQTIRLGMHAGNEPAQRLYESHGYRPTWITYRKDLQS